MISTTETDLAVPALAREAATSMPVGDKTLSNVRDSNRQISRKGPTEMLIRLKYITIYLLFRLIHITIYLSKVLGKLCQTPLLLF